jgi:hypothetical protein
MLTTGKDDLLRAVDVGCRVAPQGRIWHTQPATLLRAGCVVTAGKDNALRVVELRTLKPRATLRAPGFAVGGYWAGLALGPDERHAAAGALLQGLGFNP